MNKLPPLSQAKKVECVIIDKNSIKDGITSLTKELELTDKHPMFLEFEKLAVIHGKPGSWELIFYSAQAVEKDWFVVSSLPHLLRARLANDQSPHEWLTEVKITEVRRELLNLLFDDAPRDLKRSLEKRMQLAELASIYLGQALEQLASRDMQLTRLQPLFEQLIACVSVLERKLQSENCYCRINMGIGGSAQCTTCQDRTAITALRDSLGEK